MTMDPSKPNPQPSSAGWRRVLERVPAANDRSHVEQVLRTYVDSWASGDVEGRLALFADDVVIEDPATVRQAASKAELREFVAHGLPSDWRLAFSFERVAVVGDEAIMTYRVSLRAGDAAPAELLVNSHIVFGPDGLIHRFRTFFDAEAITDQSDAL
jgi:steroid Delta-isomerase